MRDALTPYEAPSLYLTSPPDPNTDSLAGIPAIFTMTGNRLSTMDLVSPFSSLNLVVSAVMRMRAPTTNTVIAARIRP